MEFLIRHVFEKIISVTNSHSKEIDFFHIIKSSSQVSLYVYMYVYMYHICQLLKDIFKSCITVLNIKELNKLRCYNWISSDSMYGMKLIWIQATGYKM